jgi:hypothetical protein
VPPVPDGRPYFFDGFDGRRSLEAVPPHLHPLLWGAALALAAVGSALGWGRARGPHLAAPVAVAWATSLAFPAVQQAALHALRAAGG